jgi:hypothetical protein
MGYEATDDDDDDNDNDSYGSRHHIAGFTAAEGIRHQATRFLGQ